VSYRGRGSGCSNMNRNRFDDPFTVYLHQYQIKTIQNDFPLSLSCCLVLISKC
uniref:Uncharacterized protein n=1 Tax=Lates calcarifer TaxID=8187 RepID=A0A4W6CDA2_LATCA